MFKARFRRHAFRWRSQPAITRIKEAVSEITKVARDDKVRAAEGAVVLLERLSPALEHVDSSSGAIGSAVNHAIETLADIIASAPAEAKTRERWLDRLWDAYQADEIPYIEHLGDRWGDLCASRDVASRWADRLIGLCRLALSPDPSLRGYFHGTTNCLSALFAAGRYEEIIELLGGTSSTIWHYRQYAVKALAAMGRTTEAIRYAEEGRGLNDSPIAIARACETILLSLGQSEEAYRRYALIANQAATYVAWFRAVTKKYPHKAASDVLDDLVAQTPGDEGKWFAAAKDATLFDKAIALANLTPTSPQTLTRAARDFAQTNPTFALEAGVTALRWLVQGYGYEITNLDVRNAYAFTLKAAERVGRADEIHGLIRRIVAEETSGDRFVTRELGRDLGLS
jgi:tetratricopeptide (TPR) repeat protein